MTDETYTPMDDTTIYTPGYSERDDELQRAEVATARAAVRELEMSRRQRGADGGEGVRTSGLCARLHAIRPRHIGHALEWVRTVVPCLVLAKLYGWL